MKIHWWNLMYGPQLKDVPIEEIKKEMSSFKFVMDDGDRYICALFSHNASGYLLDSYITSDDLDFCESAGEKYFNEHNAKCYQPLLEKTYFCTVTDIETGEEVYFKTKEQETG